MDFWRQLDILSPEDTKKTNINVIGVGGIGSPTVLAIAKMGIRNITIFDDDTVEPHNLPNQFYTIKDLGEQKVYALSDAVNAYTGFTITTHNEKYVDQPVEGIVISGVDSMETRKAIWEKCGITLKFLSILMLVWVHR